jgi:uncharacterized protein YbdZ (MbtH family)
MRGPGERFGGGSKPTRIRRSQVANPPVTIGGKVTIHRVWSSEPDQYGIPGNTFGNVPEEFYAIVGRVVMLSALIENRYAAIITKLAGKTEADYAGKPVGELHKIRDRLEQDHGLSERVVAIRSELDEVLKQRNEIVHSLWPSPSMDLARGWRPVVESKRVESDNHIVWIEHTTETLRVLINRLVAVKAELGSLFHDPDGLEPE